MVQSVCDLVSSPRPDILVDVGKVAACSRMIYLNDCRLEMRTHNVFDPDSTLLTAQFHVCNQWKID